MTGAANEGPLAGIRVLELTHMLAGPYCGMLLADLGAEVIKIEPPTGDIARRISPHSVGPHNAYFASLNRNKKSVVLDLAAADDRARFHGLVRNAHGLITNMRPSAIGKLGLTYDQLKAVNERIVCVALTGYGLEGPFADKPAYDYIIQALVGIMAMTGEPDGPPMKTGYSAVDNSAGIMGALGLVAKIVGGRGGQVDVSLYDVMLSQLNYVAGAHLNAGEVPRRMAGGAHPYIVPAQVFETRDGYLALFITHDGFWRKFAEEVRKPEWLTDARFCTMAARTANREAVVGDIGKLMRTKDTADWVACLGPLGIVAAGVETLPQAIASDIVRERGLIQEIPVADTTLRVVASPFKFSDFETSYRPPPLLGEHTDSVFEQAIMGAPEISADGGTVTEPQRQIPVSHHTQVLVVGAGVAGTAAVLAAARAGARTLVVERGGFAGGTGTAGLMALYTLPYEHVHGICREIIDTMAAEGAATCGQVILFDPECFKRVALAMIQDAGAEVLFYSWTVGAIVEDGRVRGVIVENKSGRQAILADVVIDASGDGDVAVSAGATFTSGREHDGKMRPMSIVFRMGPVDVRQIARYREENPGEFSPDPGHNVLDLDRRIVRLDGFFGIIRSGRDRGLLDANTHYLRLYGIAGETGDLYVNSTRVYGVDGTKGEDLTHAQHESMHQIDQLAAFLRAEIPGFEKAEVRQTAASIGVRETRRIVGDHTLGIDDCANGRRFPDAIATAMAHMVPGVEIHSPDAGEGDADDSYVAGLVLPFQEFSVPLRCLLPRGLDGILVAGRCISTTHEADGWTRNQPVMMQIGEGAGTVAAMAVMEGRAPRDVDIAKVQGSLRQHAALVLLPEP